MSTSNEFETVDLIVKSNSETRGVDAFALAVIKAERQLRKLLTHLVFQFPCFGPADVDALRSTLSHNKDIYFKETEDCVNAIFFCTVEDMVGADYQRLRSRIGDAIQYRNKIFHGQLTQRRLTREDLLVLVSDIRRWCDALSAGANSSIGYDGFARNSFHKSGNRYLSRKFKVQFEEIEDYAEFLAVNKRRR